MKGLQAILHQVEAKYSKGKVVNFKPGDSVKVSLKVKEGEKERVQVYEGVVISRGKEGSRETFRVRRISYGVGVERVFPFHSPSIVKIEVTKRGVAFKARLFHLRGKSAKDSRIAEMRATDKGGALTPDAVVPETPEQKAAAAKAEVEKAARMAERAGKKEKSGDAKAEVKAEAKPDAKAEAKEETKA
jgi:large subunit ribosomal protein L19